mmetsp:Transcript_14520/g.29812  ORF Transcript_14520/g.29812 Transcript_14520/m.29812 type:complete len:184 (-) Transcript_14520:220-771(-)|eukprot:CAMPEP_0118654338 /NCGR_PEP_ID=MMETSP0785-20121206/12338_1 /TAXON_ID=91992 /ORGANISM="Bolidomonas pacifica, Strain CCMP 1866" /LENGTH=183 /DNA_ID=CAMNT_0006546995 /DNA_START=71 /DNA_END=622 /DNA_ORIENTATION=+
MYSGKAVAEAKKLAEERAALQMRAFDRVIGKQLDIQSKKATAAASKKVDTEAEYKAKLDRSREKAQKKGGKKLSSAHLKMAKETGLSGAVVARMMDVEDEGTDDSDDDSSSESSGRKKKKKKKSKKDKKKKRKKEKKDKKRKKSKKNRKRDREEDEDGEEGSSSGEEEGSEEGRTIKRRKEEE